MATHLERYMATVPRSVVRFANSAVSSSEPTHHKWDSSLASTVKECSDRFEVSPSHDHHTGVIYYSLGLKTLDHLGRLLQRSTPEAHEEVAAWLEILQDTSEITRWAAIGAHMRNEECARLAAMVSQIKQHYFDRLEILDCSRKMLAIYTSMIVCERWSLDQLKASIRNGSRSGLTFSEFYQAHYASVFLLDQLRKAYSCSIMVEFHRTQAEQLANLWDRQHNAQIQKWNWAFDETVAIRQYARDLGPKANGVESEVNDFYMLAEANGMAEDGN